MVRADFRSAPALPRRGISRSEVPLEVTREGRAGWGWPLPGPHSVTVCDGGFGARLQLIVLLACASITRPFNYRGMRRISIFLGKVFSPQNSAVMSDGQRNYKVYLDDPYWVKYLHAGFSYEKDMEGILGKALARGTVFLDCGANIGYWSLYGAQKVGAPGRVVAVEATSRSFDRLCENSKLNEGAFTGIKKGIYSQSGLDLEFETHPARHGANSCVRRRGKPGDTSFQREWVKSITIDDLLKEVLSGGAATREIVIKLDVEGAEIEAFKGAEEAFRRGALFIYEDHGNDPNSTITDFVLNRLSLPVYFIKEDSSLIRIQNLEQLRDLKEYRIAYNLATAREDSPVLKRLLQAR
jgi:FkbM family methyltransferase